MRGARGTVGQNSRGAVRSLAAVVRKSRKCGVGVVEEVRQSGESLVVVGHLERVFLVQIEVQAPGREAALLSARGDVAEVLEIGIGSRHDAATRRRRANIAWRVADNRIYVAGLPPGGGRLQLIHLFQSAQRLSLEDAQLLEQ